MVGNKIRERLDTTEINMNQNSDSVTHTVFSPANIRREDLNTHAWSWDNNKGANLTRHTIYMTDDNREVKFHPSYSSGTGVVRGDTQFVRDHDYYWEIKILTPLYGTDVMIGVGTAKVDLLKQQFNFCSILGLDSESWGYSYNGTLHHDRKWQNYGPSFNKHCTVGVHLDMWNGTLSYFLNGIPLGVAFTNLKNHVLYPMVSSTAAHSAIKLIYSYTCASSLQQLCLRSLSSQANMMKIVSSVPGLQLHATKTFLNYKTVTVEDVQQKINQVKNVLVINDDGDNCIKSKKSKRARRKCTNVSRPIENDTLSRMCGDSERGCPQCGAKLLTYNNLESDSEPSCAFKDEYILCLACADIM